jgi:hypothetical protein
MARKITYAKLKSMDATEISKLSQKEAAEMLKQFREKFRYRQKAFNRAGKNVYSPALEKMQDYYDRNGVQSPEALNVNRIRSELFHIQEFFNSKTADVKGARQVMREQDARIFGTNEKGAPLKRMTIEERTKFWSVYEEYLKTFKNAEAIYGSDKIQQFLGDLTLGNRGRKNIFSGDIGLIQQLNALNTMLRESEGEHHVELRNVRQGL